MGGKCLEDQGNAVGCESARGEVEMQKARVLQQALGQGKSPCMQHWHWMDTIGGCELSPSLLLLLLLGRVWVCLVTAVGGSSTAPTAV